MASINVLEYAEEAVSAANLYAQWAAELGVSATETLMALDGDDSVWGFEIASPVMGVPGMTQGEFSSEGLIGWSVSPKKGTPWARLKDVFTGTSFPSRMYYFGDEGASVNSTFRPDRFVMFRMDPNDNQSIGVKLQKANGDTILGGTVRQLGQPSIALDFAMRFYADPAKRPLFRLTVKTRRVDVGSDVKAKVVFADLNTKNQLVLAGIAVPLSELVSYPTDPAEWKSFSFASKAIEITARIPTLGMVRPVIGTKKDFPVPSMPKIGLMRHNIAYNGPGSVAGTVTELEKAVQRVVRLYKKNTGALVAQTESAADGSYSFSGLELNTAYFVVSHDRNLKYNAVIADEIYAEVRK